MIKLFVLLSLIFRATAPSPEILAEPVPLLRQSTIHTYVAPLWERGAGHRGIDIALPENFELKSPFAGQVHFVGKVVDRKVMTLVSESGLKASFEPVCGFQSLGTTVSKRQAIGVLCVPETDYEMHCESCLHVSLRNSYGYLNPLLFYGELRPPGLTR